MKSFFLFWVEILLRSSSSSPLLNAPRSLLMEPKRRKSIGCVSKNNVNGTKIMGPGSRYCSIEKETSLVREGLSTCWTSTLEKAGMCVGVGVGVCVCVSRT